MDKRIQGESYFVKKPITILLDQTEISNRYKNYANCVNNFFNLYTTTEQLEHQLNQIHVESMCHKERLDLIDFAERSGFSYNSLKPSKTQI
jgi:hypothetical protein